MASVVRRASFDFYKDERAAIDGDQVDLANAIAVPASDDDVAELFQIAGGRVFAAEAERLGLEGSGDKVEEISVPRHEIEPPSRDQAWSR
jgi:hypothetical protein